MAALVKVTLSGDTETQAFLKNLRGSIHRKIVKQAMTEAVKPLKPAIKKEAPRDKGTMRRAAAVKVKSYAAKGVVFGIAGVRRDTINKKTGGRPSKVLHLVIRGVKQHDIKPETKKVISFKKKRARKKVFAMLIKHPGFQGDNFIDRAYQSTKAEVERTFAARLEGYIAGLK